jgi:hypothetical protein
MPQLTNHSSKSSAESSPFYCFDVLSGVPGCMMTSPQAFPGRPGCLRSELRAARALRLQNQEALKPCGSDPSWWVIDAKICGLWELRGSHS